MDAEPDDSPAIRSNCNDINYANPFDVSSARNIFSSLTQTAKLRGAPVLDLFGALLAGTPAQAHDVLFDDSS